MTYPHGTSISGRARRRLADEIVGGETAFDLDTFGIAGVYHISLSDSPTAASSFEGASEALLRRVVVELASLRQELHEPHRRLVMVGTLDNTAYRMRFPIGVELIQEEEGYTAHSHDLEVFGAGESEYEALADFRQSLVDAFELLEAEPELGPIPQSQLMRLRQVIESERDSV